MALTRILVLISKTSLHTTIYLNRVCSHMYFCSLGLAYAGSNREDVISLLLPVLGDSGSDMEVGYLSLPKQHLK